jgi:fucose permease
MNAQAVAVERTRGRQLMNSMHACWSLGAFAGAGVGAGAVALGIGLTPQLLVIGLPTAVAAVLLSVRMIGDRTALADDAEPADADQAAPPPAASRTRLISAAMLLLGAVAFASMLCEGAAADWSSVYVHDSLHGSSTIAGFGYTAFALAMMLIRVTGDRLLARFGIRRIIPLLAVVAAAAMAVALAVGTVATALTAFFLLGLGVGSVVPTAFSAAGRLPGVHPGQGVAGVSGLGWAGFVLGPPIIGQLAGAFSLPVALGLVPLLCTFIAVAAIRMSALRG